MDVCRAGEKEGYTKCMKQIRHRIKNNIFIADIVANDNKLLPNRRQARVNELHTHGSRQNLVES